MLLLLLSAAKTYHTSKKSPPHSGVADTNEQRIRESIYKLYDKRKAFSPRNVTSTVHLEIPAKIEAVPVKALVIKAIEVEWEEQFFMALVASEL